MKAGNEKYKCFVIMPFSATTNEHTGDYWSNHYEKFLKPLIEENEKIVCYRSQALREDILDEIISSLITSQIVVADLTDHNANVFWELGVRQSFSYRTITIAEYGTKLPFDVKSKGTLFYYPGDHIENQDFIAEFRNALEDCVKFPDKPDSIVLEAISGRGTLYHIIEKQKVLRQLDSLISEICYNKKIISQIKLHLEKIKSLRKSDKKMNKVDEEKTDFSKTLKIIRNIRTISVEYLLVNRYISDNDEFYKKIESYYDFIILVNQYIKDLASLFSFPTGKLEVIFRSIDIDLDNIESEIINIREKIKIQL